MYAKVDVAILLLYLLSKYLIKICFLTKIHSELCILYKKHNRRKLELMMSIYIDEMFMAGKLENLEKRKELLKLKFNIQESGNVNFFLGVYYERLHDKKGPYYKITMEKDVNKLVNRYKNTFPDSWMLNFNLSSSFCFSKLSSFPAINISSM